jgi:hypothetical protein
MDCELCGERPASREINDRGCAVYVCYFCFRNCQPREPFVRVNIPSGDVAQHIGRTVAARDQKTGIERAFSSRRKHSFW